MALPLNLDVMLPFVHTSFHRRFPTRFGMLVNHRRLYPCLSRVRTRSRRLYRQSKKSSGREEERRREERKGRPLFGTNCFCGISITTNLQQWSVQGEGGWRDGGVARFIGLLLLLLAVAPLPPPLHRRRLQRQHVMKSEMEECRRETRSRGEELHHHSLLLLLLHSTPAASSSPRAAAGGGGEENAGHWKWALQKEMQQLDE